MREYIFIIADAEVEIIPERIAAERCVLNSARARSKSPERMLLDASHHHPAFGKLPDGDRRGRPDIVHLSLLLLLDSDVNAKGRLKIFVHTRNDDVIAVNPETRLPSNYIRFVGLIEQLFEQKVVPSSENALLELRHKVPLDMLVNALNPDEVIVIGPYGGRTPLDEVFSASESGRTVVILGGFSKGTYRSDLRKLDAKQVSLSDRTLKTWTVASKALRAVEEADSTQPPSVDTEYSAKKASKKTAKTTKSSRARRARSKKED